MYAHTHAHLTDMPPRRCTHTLAREFTYTHIDIEVAMYRERDREISEVPEKNLGK